MQPSRMTQIKNGLGLVLLRPQIVKMCWLPALCLLATVAPVKADTWGDYVYTIHPLGIRIDEYTGTNVAETIPSIIASRSVIGIARYAFSASANLASVTIPDTVTYLEDYVFHECANLTDVTIGKGLASIGFRVFDYCTNLTTITVDAGNSTNSSLAGVLFSSNQTTLVQYPLGKTGAYTIPDGVTSIGREAFFYCTLLTGITLPNSVTSIGNQSFWGCTGLAGVTIPNSVISIGEDAFWGCTSLASATIGSSVASIGNSAFYECTGLTGITIPASVTNIGDGAFIRCTNLAAITVNAGNSAYGSSEGVLFNKGQTTLIQCPGGKTSYTIPASVTSIGNGAFGWCNSLNNVTIPNSVTSIEDNGFLYCTSLGSVTIPNSVTNIGHEAFENCTSLTAITLPVSITSIKYWTFISCTSLANITIPAGVTNIGDSAFASCTSLAGVYFRGNAPGGSTNVFYNDDNATVYYVNGTTGWEQTFGGRPTALWNAPPAPTIKANGAIINYPGAVSVTVEMDAGSYLGAEVDWWILVNAGSSWYYMDSVAGWTQGVWHPVNQGPLFNLSALEVLNIPGLAPGSYTFYFAVDYPMDGILNVDGLIFVDSVNVVIQ